MFFSFKKYNNNTVGGILIHFGLAVLLLLILAILYFYLYLPSITNHNESITVPSIEGMKIEQIDKFLGDRNLRWEVNDSSYSEDYPPLTVLKQFPKAGSKVKENRKIYVSVNRINPPTVPLPNLTDWSLENAESVLQSNELRRGKIEMVTGPWLNVVKEMKHQGRPIAAGSRIPKGSVIDLVVMDGGSDKVTIPSMVNESYEDAKLLILGLNLSLGKIITIGDTTGIEIVVLKQKPEAYSSAKVGDLVDLVIGKEGIEVDDLDEDDE